jgi:integrase
MAKPRTGTVFWSDRYKCYVAKMSATHPITGKIRQWERHAETSKEAHGKLKEISSLADKWLKEEAPESFDPSKITFDDLTKIFEKKKLVKAKYVNGRKISGRRSLGAPKTWMASLREYFGKKRLVTIKHSDLEDFKSHLADKPKRKRGGGQRSLAAINRELEFLRTILNFAVTNGYLERNPFHAGKGRSIIDKSGENGRERFPTFGEEIALLAHCVGARKYLAASLVIAVDTGLRENEMLTLAVTDLDFKYGVINLKAEHAKNGRARQIPMTNRVKERLAALCENETDLVFGKVRNQQHTWEAVREKAGIENLTWHDLRHAFVTRSILAGIPPAAVLKASGHASDEWKRYLNMTPDQMRRLLLPMEGQSQDEVNRYAATVMRGLRDALHYDEIEKIFDLLKD